MKLYMKEHGTDWRETEERTGEVAGDTETEREEGIWGEKSLLSFL